jgi:hypothetical protein
VAPSTPATCSSCSSTRGYRGVAATQAARGCTVLHAYGMAPFTSLDDGRDGRPPTRTLSAEKSRVIAAANVAFGHASSLPARQRTRSVWAMS